MGRRMIGVFCTLLLLMTLAIFRVYYVGASDYLAQAAAVQGRYALEIASSRANIYDRNMERLVNRDYRYIAAVLPTPQAATELMKVLPEEEREAVLERLTAGLPFALEVDGPNIYAAGIDVFRVPVRYADDEQLAVHLIGYLGDEGRAGVAGLERAYDDLLGAGGAVSVSYDLDAAGRTLQGGGVEVRRDGEAEGGLVLTLDAGMQRIAQAALEHSGRHGAVVVLDIATGDILAMASGPAFDQNNIAASLDSEDAPFINRAISGYNIGSVFKLAVSACALESGQSRYREYDCQGYIDIGGQVFRCNNHAVHGTVDMQRALEVSCNTYFINLAQDLDPQALLAMCELMGIGRSVELAPGLSTQSGNLPSAAELENPAALANFSFGQGSSLATPLQIAQMIAVIAGDGYTVTPRLVLGTSSDGTAVDEPYAAYAGGRALTMRTAETMQELMISVIEEGSGRTASPLSGGAGGKTSSAQTGIMTVDEVGEEVEIVHAWFAGFYPAEQPRYAVAVFVEGGESGEQVAAPIFKEIVDGIYALSLNAAG